MAKCSVVGVHSTISVDD